LCFFATNSFSQISQNGIFFQAVAKDNYDNPANRRQLFIQSSIIQANANGTKVLIEEFQTTTDQAGVFTISIGKGIRKGGTINKLLDIDWANGPYFLNLKIVITPIAPTAGWDYTKEWFDIGTTSFGTVPYALYASSSGDLGNKVNISDSIIKYVTPTQLNAKAFDITPIIFSLSNKVDKVVGKDLSTNDYTAIEKSKLSIISGINTGDETSANIKSKLGITNLSGSNTGDQDVSSFATITNLALKANLIDVDSVLKLKANSSDIISSLGLKANLIDVDSVLKLKANIEDVLTSLFLKANQVEVDSIFRLKANISDITTLRLKANQVEVDSIFRLKANISDITTLRLKANQVEVDSIFRLKANISDITTLRLKANQVEVDSIFRLKANISEVNTSFILKANATDLTAGLGLKVDKVEGKELSSNNYSTVEKNKLAAITGTNEGDETTATIKTKLGITTLSGSNTGDQDLSSFATITNLSFKANSSDVNTSLGLKANSSDLISGLALKANTNDVVSGLSLKEDQLNKSDATNLGGTAANDILYPTQKAVKAYVDGQISSGGVADASILSRHIASLNITTPLIADASITDIKISNGINQSKVGLGKVENTALSTWQGSNNLTNLGTITSGIWSGTSVAVAHGGTGANTASNARFNLGLVIGTNVQAPLIPGTHYIVPNTPIINSAKTKITYDVNGLVTAGADATTLDISPSVNRNYVTDIQSGVLSNTSGVNSGDETTGTIKSKLGITTLSGTNTGDQDISLFATITNLDLKANTADMTTSLELKANATDLTAGLALKANTAEMNTSLELKANATDLSSGLALKANTSDMTTSLGLKANATDLTTGLALKVDKVTGKELSTNDYTTAEKTKLAAILGTNTGDQDVSSFATITNLDLKANTADMTISLGLKANVTDLSSGLALKANSSDVTTSLGLKANTTDLTTGLALKVDKVTGKELSTNDYTTAEKTKLAAILGTNTGDQDVSSFATITNLALKANTSDMTTSLALKANLISPTLVTPILGEATATSVTASSDIKAKRYIQYLNTAISSTSTTNLDLSRGNVIQVNLATSIAGITFTNEAVGTYLIKFVQTVGSKTVNFPDTWLWSGGAEPVVSATLGRTDIVTLIYDGTNYYAAIVQNFF
jgi:hypothetical protein